MLRIFEQNFQKINFVLLLIYVYNVKINDAVYDIAFF